MKVRVEVNKSGDCRLLGFIEVDEAWWPYEPGEFLRVLPDVEDFEILWCEDTELKGKYGGVGGIVYVERSNTVVIHEVSWVK